MSLNAPLCPVCYLHIVFDDKPCLICCQKRSIGWTPGGHQKVCKASDLRRIAQARADNGDSTPMKKIVTVGSRRSERCDVCDGEIRQLS